MATIEPPDDAFERLMSQVDFGDAADEAPAAYGELSDLHLVDRFDLVREKLLDMGELLDPKTPEAKDLHAEYHGLLLEKRRRRL